jgi:hypothetical protein
MTLKRLLWCLAVCSAALVILGAEPAADPAIPRLEKRGQATQLIVDGKPWLILGGETANTASSDLAYMETVWPQLARLNLNTALVAVAWSWIEPAEGRFNFTLVDGLLDGARRNNLRVVFLWFGSWKNGHWKPNRQLSGDDVLLDYDLAGAAARNQSGSGLRFNADGPTVQRVTLYRYR